MADGLFDLGITGRDWIEERGATWSRSASSHYSKATANPIRVVLAVARGLAGARRWPTWRRDRGVLRVSTEYPELTRRLPRRHGVEAEVSLSYGATEAKVPDIADCVVEITETGRALRAAGLRIVETLLVSHTELIANPAAAADPSKRHAMDQLLTLLQGALEAREKVLVKLNVPADQLAGGDRPCSRRCGRPRCPSSPAAAGSPSRRGPQVGDQHAHPGAQGPGGDRHHRAGPVQDRPLRRDRAAPGPAAVAPVSEAPGGVDAFDGPGAGVGGRPGRGLLPFHCTAIADGSRHIEVGPAVSPSWSCPATWAGSRPRAGGHGR